ncbi:HAD family hydrolase [Rubeoparvulum massiliense]|uniref:HAD family hydrolase n=1 Tax=Rubeoparvulum massiliense TaxID=1631346 RepID=UPI00065E52D1|nr:HAD family hydrolase [Rubeoparvulum massiliense]
MVDWTVAQMELLVFDLDGTLYEEQAHFTYYARCLQEMLPLERQADFWQDYQNMQSGTHIALIGKIYDIKRDLVLTVEPLMKRVQAVHCWNGEPLPQSKWPSEYQAPIELRYGEFLGIGDRWILATTAALHQGLTNGYPAYQKTKLYLASPDFMMRKTPGLKEALARYQGTKKIVLLSNSDEDAAHEILEKLDLHSYFDWLIPRAGKPMETKNWLQKVLQTYQIQPEHAISIGDNLFNEVLPAIELGMKSIYIYDGKMEFTHPSLIQVETLANYPF